MAGRKHHLKLSVGVGLKGRNDLPVVLHLKRRIGQGLRSGRALSNGSSSNGADRNGSFDAARSGLRGWLRLGKTEQREKGKHESKEKSIHKDLDGTEPNLIETATTSCFNFRTRSRKCEPLSLVRNLSLTERLFSNALLQFPYLCSRQNKPLRTRHCTCAWFEFFDPAVRR